MECVITALLTAWVIAIALLAYRKWKVVESLREAVRAAYGAKSAFDAACLEMRRRTMSGEPGVVPVSMRVVTGADFASGLLRAFDGDLDAPMTYDQMKDSRDSAIKMVNSLSRPGLDVKVNGYVDAILGAALKRLTSSSPVPVRQEFDSLNRELKLATKIAFQGVVPLELRAKYNSVVAAR